VTVAILFICESCGDRYRGETLDVEYLRKCFCGGKIKRSENWEPEFLLGLAEQVRRQVKGGNVLS